MPNVMNGRPSNEPAPPMLPKLFFQKTPSKHTRTTTTTMDTPRDHYMEALHLTRDNHWIYHWFDPNYPPPPTHPEAWKPSCDDEGCGHWNHCYECNDSIASLLVNKAEFLAWKELEKEYPRNCAPGQTSKMKLTPKG
jgi:hypothetical protein